MQISGALEEKKNFFLFFSMKTVETTPKDSKSVSCQVLERPSYYFIFREKSCNRMKKEGGGEEAEKIFCEYLSFLGQIFRDFEN